MLGPRENGSETVRRRCVVVNLAQTVDVSLVIAWRYAVSNA